MAARWLGSSYRGLARRASRTECMGAHEHGLLHDGERPSAPLVDRIPTGRATPCPFFWNVSFTVTMLTSPPADASEFSLAPREESASAARSTVRGSRYLWFLQKAKSLNAQGRDLSSAPFEPGRHSLWEALA